MHIAQALALAGHKVVAVEPNTDPHDALPLAPLQDALRSADVFAVLMKHR